MDRSQSQSLRLKLPKVMMLVILMLVDVLVVESRGLSALTFCLSGRAQLHNAPCMVMILHHHHSYD